MSGKTHVPRVYVLLHDIRILTSFVCYNNGMEFKGHNSDITREIIGCAIEVHKVLGGPGILEKAYQRALAYELMQAGHKVELEAPCPIIYKGNDLSDPEHPLRIDLLVDDSIVVECKAVSSNNPIFAAQCQSPCGLDKLLFCTVFVLNLLPLLGPA